MKKINIIDGIIADIDERGYAEISISDTITEIPIDIDNESYCYDDDRYYTSCIADFIEQNSIKNIKIIGGGENLKDISKLFSFCTNLQSVDLTEFNTSNIKNMSYMFLDCENLKTVKFGVLPGLFKIPNNINMEYMFEGCPNFESMHLFNINTSIKRMDEMYDQCSNDIGVMFKQVSLFV